MRRTPATYYVLALPAVILFFIFHTFPALQGVMYSFTDSKGFGAWEFIGFENYKGLFKDPLVLHSYKFTIGVALVATVLTNIISLAVAVGLNATNKLKNFLRGIYFLPAVMAMLVIGYIFNFIFANAVPEFGKVMGIDVLSRNILGNPSLAWIGVVVVTVWQGMATTIVIYLAGLQTVPEEVSEAAELDGATGWQQFWRITFPLLAPFFTVNMVLSLKNYLMIFDQVVALTMGGPGTSTMSISYLIYRNGFQGGQFAYQSANAVIYFLVIAFISILQLRLLRSREVDA